MVVGYPESNDAVDLVSSFNQSLLPAIGMLPRFSVARAYRLRSVHPDVSLRFCKLDFESILARDELLAKAQNLKGQSGLAGVQIRPALMPSQCKRKRILDHFRWSSFQKDFSGQFPVAVRYELSGDPYLRHFGRKERVEPPVFIQPTTMSVESSSSSS